METRGELALGYPLSQVGSSLVWRLLMMVGLWLEGLTGAREWVRGREWVKRRPPHLGAIDAFLPAERMFVDGSGRDRWGGAAREGLGGWFAPAEIQTGAGDCASPAGRQGSGEALHRFAEFSLASDLWTECPTDLSCATYLPRPPEQSHRETSRYSSSRPGSDTHATVDKIPYGPRTSCS